MTITRLYRTPGLSTVERSKAVATARNLGLEIDAIDTEHCFYVASDGALEDRQLDILRWLLAETFEPEGFSDQSFLATDGGEVLEVGPRMSFSTAWSTNAVSVCHACGLTTVTRIERSGRFAMPAMTE
jgi:phosphoribosylformylglycinamidine synthase